MERRAAATPDEVAFVSSNAASTTFRQFGECVSTASALLSSMGVGPGSRVAILLPTSFEWEVAQFAILRAGAVVVGFDPRSDARSLTQCLEIADVSAILVDGMARIAALEPHARARLRVVLCADQAEGSLRWRAYVREEDGALWPASTAISSEAARPCVDPSAIATLVFSSGSLGLPKALAFTHAQLLRAAYDIALAFPGIGPGSHLVGWLPLASLFQRMIDVAAIMVGATTHYVADPRDAVACARAVSPQVFVAVPRFLQELRRGLLARVDWRWRSVLRLTLTAARAIGRAKRTGKGRPVFARFIQAILRGPTRRLRTVLGKNLEAVVVGSAPTPRAIVDELEGLGIPVLEAYGLSECVLPVAMNRLSDRKPGTVGRVLSAHEVRIAGDGEVEIRSEALATPVGCALPLTEDRFLRTGDLGKLDEDGFLTLLGRKATVLKLSDGRTLDPVAIEQRLETIPWVEQVQVIGHGHARPGAIVWLSITGVPGERALQGELRRALHGNSRRERPSQYVIVRRPASIDLGEITTTMKLRRVGNTERYARFFDDTSLDDRESLTWMPATS